MIGICVLGMTGLAFFAGWVRFQDQYIAHVQLVEQELPSSFRTSETGEPFKPRQLAMATIISMMESRAFLQEVVQDLQLPLTARELNLALTVVPERNTDIIAVSLKAGRTREAAANAVNAYAAAVVDLTRRLQREESAEVAAFLAVQTERMQKELEVARHELLQYSEKETFFHAEQEVGAYLRELAEVEQRLATVRTEHETLDLRIAAIEKELAQQNPQIQRLLEERDLLRMMLTRYTESNPLVLEQKAKVEALHEALQQAPSAQDFQFSGNPVANSFYMDLVNLRTQRLTLARQLDEQETLKSRVEGKLRGLPVKSVEYAAIRGRVDALEATLGMLTGRQREAALFAERPPGSYRLFAPAQPDQVEEVLRNRKIALVSVAGMVLGAFLGLVGVSLIELLDDRILSPSDVARATGVPVLARLGDLSALSQEEARLWRFRLLATLRETLHVESGRPFVVAITSLHEGEGRSTWAEWIRLAAKEQPVSALLITNCAESGQEADPSERAWTMEEAVAQPDAWQAWLTGSPGRCARVLWNTDTVRGEGFRNLLGELLRQHSRYPAIPMIVELPPLFALEGVLAAGVFPAVLWLVSSGMGRQRVAAQRRDTLRAGHVHLMGSLANRVPRIYESLPDLSRYGFLWLGLITLFLAGATSPLQAQERDIPAENPTFSTVPSQVGTHSDDPVLERRVVPLESTSGVASGGADRNTSGEAGRGGGFSATAGRPRLAHWQERLVLGPGDRVTLSFYGDKELTRPDVPIGPDGRVSYLQAQGVMAAGKTVDELRDALNEALRAYYRFPRVIVTPEVWVSKKYFLMGAVQDRGVYPLDRPITIIEAVARARGLATGLLDLNTVEIADLSRAMLVRNGQRVPINFERLFQQGDLSQNSLLEPDDYLFFPSSSENDAYVLGSVEDPGPIGVSENSSVVSLLTVRGGFTERAHRQKVLVVRGSLNKPETFVVNVAAILSGRAPDFRVEPKDIIYVAERPWARAEDLLDVAVSAFITTATATWASRNIGPSLTTPIVPQVP